MQPSTLLLAAMSLNLGGAETHVVSLARELGRRGHRVLVASQGGRLTGELQQAEVPHFFVPLHSRAPWKLVQAVSGLSGIIREQRVDLIHAHARIPAWAGEVARRGLNVPMVTTYHGVYNSSLPMRLVTRWGDKVIAVSDDIKAYLISRFGVPAHLVTVIPNGIDINRFSPGADPGRLLEELGGQPRDPRIVHVSRLDGTFADVAFALAEAVNSLARRYPDIQAVIVGGGRRLEELHSKAAAINRSLGRPAVKVVGAREDIPRFFAVATVVVGVARVALEAMASGKAVIIAGEGGYRGLLTPATFEELRRYNFTARGSGSKVTAERLAGDIAACLEHGDVCRETARFGREMVEKLYSIEAVTDRIEEVYSQLLVRRTVDGLHR